jgi:hypothetical protein
MEVLGITVKETNEKLTVYHHGGHFEMTDSIVESELDYHLVSVEKSIKGMGAYGDDGEIDKLEAF